MNRIPVPSPFRNVADVVAGLCRLENSLVSSGDRRGVFVAAYLEITRTLQKRLGRQYFHDDEGVSRYIVAFAELYRRAFANYERGKLSEVPTPWVFSFEASRAGNRSISEDLLLGINAHINHDLAFAIIRARLNLCCDSSHSDHTRINDALRVATPIVRKKILRLYQPGQRLQSLLLGRSIDKVTTAAFRQARRNAWTAAQALDSAKSFVETERISRVIENRASLAAQLIRDHNERPKRCIEILQEVEDLMPIFSPA